MTRILVLGSGGMLGHKVLQRLATEHEVTGTLRVGPETPPYRDIPLFRDGRIVHGVDGAIFATVAGAITTTRPEVVVNCIGVIKQKDHDPIANIAINALFPHLLAAHCAATGARMIHFGTDCVFRGTRGSYREDDTADATDLYGRTKYLGEVADAAHVLTLRTSLVGRELAGFGSLLEWFLGQHGAVKGFRRAFFSGVTTNWMADTVARIVAAHPGLHGRYQVAGPRISKHDLLEVFGRAYGRDTAIAPDDDFVLDRSLIGDRFTADTGLQAPSWEDMVATMAADPTPYEEWR